MGQNFMFVKQPQVINSTMAKHPIFTTVFKQNALSTNYNAVKNAT